MTVKVDVSLYDDYFSDNGIITNYDHFSGMMLFASGLRPIEFMNVSLANIFIPTDLIRFQQAKGGGVTERSIDNSLLLNISELWQYNGNPLNYYYNYQRLAKYIRRMITPNFQITNRLDELYPFRYACAGALLHQGFTDQEIIDFFDHGNGVNTAYYISMGHIINAQLFGS